MPVAETARPRLLIVSPNLQRGVNGNAHTASRWQRFLQASCDVTSASAWQGEDVAALIALHAVKSADSIDAYRKSMPDRPIVVVLTGTDLYGELTGQALQHSLECASVIVVLQAEALTRLTLLQRAKAVVIEQSATAVGTGGRKASAAIESTRATGAPFIAVGHLRAEKDPSTLLRAVGLLDGAVDLGHIGAALDPALGDAALAMMRDFPRYRWLGALGHAETRRRIAAARALVHPSRLEGGANVVIEAICSQVPVLASRIDGNVGLLGEDYDGYFEVGDAAALAALLRRFDADAEFAAHLRRQCAARAPRFVPARERAAVRGLLAAQLGIAPR